MYDLSVMLVGSFIKSRIFYSGYVYNQFTKPNLDLYYTKAQNYTKNDNKIYILQIKQIIEKINNL